MVRFSFICVLTALLGLAVGLMINLRVVGNVFRTATPSAPALTAVQDQPKQNDVLFDVNGLDEENLEHLEPKELGFDQPRLLHSSYAVLASLQAQDFERFSSYIHPEEGVTFTPYSTVDRSSDRTFLPNELSLAAENDTQYVWGLQDGSGSPIQMTISDYFNRYVFNADYSSAPLIGVNTVLSNGNSLENVAEAYPDAYFVEFHYPYINSNNLGFDWCGLKLVFVPFEGAYKLVGIIHSEWTT